MVETTGPARMCPVQRAVGSEAKDDMTEVMSDKDLLDALDPDHPGLEPRPKESAGYHPSASPRSRAPLLAMKA